MSPKVFRYLLVASFLLKLASSALRIQECMYEDEENPIAVKDVGYQACLMKYGYAQGDLLNDMNPKNLMKIMIFPHSSSKIILTQNPVYYDCGTCNGCRQYLTECSTQPDFVDLEICSSLYLEPASEICVVSTDSSRQFMINPNNSTVMTFVDPQEGIDAKEILREKRYTKACSFPNALETAQINCRLYEKKVKCIQRCAFGYTFDKVIKQEMECKYKENIWKPTGFRECRPFVDCTLTLVTPGDANCTSMSLKNKPSCRVTCLEYEDKKVVPETVYTCDINGKWDPPLPFCAIPGTGLALTKAPEKKLHDDEIKSIK